MQQFCKYTFLLLVLNASLSAQVIPVENSDLPELEMFYAEVLATPEADDMLSDTTSFISGEELNRQLASSLGETLSWEPGISSSFYGPVASRPVIRGQSGYRVGVYSSGMQTGDLSSASPDHAVTLEPLFIREIEIIRGPATLLYGSSAIGGAVNVETTTLARSAPQQTIEAETELRYDTVNAGRTAGVATTIGEEHWAIQANALARETNSYRIPGYARTTDYDYNNRIRLPSGVPQPAPNSEGIVPNTQSSLLTGSVGLSGFWSQGWIGAAFIVYDTDYGVPSDGHGHGNLPSQANGPGPYDAVTIQMNQRKGEVESEFWPETDWLDTISVKANYSDLKQDEYEGSYLGNHFDAQTYDTRIEMNSAALDSWSFAGGGSLSGFELFNKNLHYIAGRADEDTLSTRSLTGALFGLAQYSEDDWEAQLGGRAEFQHAERSDLTNVGRNDSAYSASIGAARRLSEDGKVSLTLSYLERVPTADELYVEAPHGATGIFQIPNPNLDNESSLGMDLSLIKDRGAWTFTATGFVRHFDNYIFLENQGYEVDGLPAYKYVQRQANFVGAELESAWALIDEEDESLVATALWDVVYATDITKHQPLPRIQPMRVGIRLDYDRGPWDFGIGVRHAFAQNQVPQAVFGTLDYQSPTPAYTFLDANIGYTFVQEPWEARVFIIGTNLTDAEGRNAVSFLKDIAPLPGRNITLGIELSY